MRSFARSLEQSYMKLAGGLAAARALLDEVASIVAELEHTPPRVLVGVPETLAYLSSRHRMILFTKGEPAERRPGWSVPDLQGFLPVIPSGNCSGPTRISIVYGRLVDKQPPLVKSYAWLRWAVARNWRSIRLCRPA